MLIKIGKCCSLAFAMMILGNAAAWSNQKITMIYTNSLNGNIDFCHCKENPNGGMVKRATVFNKLRRTDPEAFFFDTGDFMLYERDVILAKYLVEGFRYLGYDAIVCGDQEFTMGPAAFYRLSRKLPIVCNNLSVRDTAGEMLSFKRTLLLEKGGITIGVIGSIAENTFLYYDKNVISTLKVVDQLTEIRKDVTYLKKQNPDLVVLLSHSGLERDKKIARDIGGIDVIIGGHTQNLIKAPEKIGNTVIVQAGMNGSHIGVLKIVLLNSKIVKINNAFIVPDDTQPHDDPYVRSLINRYKEENKARAKDIRFN